MDRRQHHYVLLFLLICLVGHSYGSRHTQVFRVMKPKGNDNSVFALPPTFFGFLPKAMPIPPSGPSRNHNSIGLQSSLGKP